MPTENCLFCLEPVGAGDLAVPNLPCMCRTPQHDDCRARWNGMNPYRCPICRKTFTPEAGPPPVQRSIHVGMYNDFQLRNGPDPQFIVPPVQRPYPMYQESLYITIPSAPPSPSAPAPGPAPSPAPSAPVSVSAQAPAQAQPNFQTQMTPQERRRYLFDVGCKAIACLGLLLILLVVILIIKGT